MKKDPSVVMFTAGKKNRESVDKAILHDDDPEAKESF